MPTSISVTSGTIFSGRKLAFTDILYAIALFANGAKGVSALQLSRDVNVQYKTAFVLLHKLREAMASLLPTTVSGEVKMDGAYFGGKVRQPNVRKHKIDRRHHRYGPKKKCIVVARKRGGRSLVLLASEPQAAARATAFIEPGSIVHTDEAKEYNPLSAYFDHRRINHSVSFSERGGLSTNQAESFFARMRRSEFGVHHAIAGPYLAAYAAENAWRENSRRMANGEQFMSIAGGGLRHPVSRQWKGSWQRRGGELMATFRFHLIANRLPVDLEVEANDIGDLCEIISRQRFVEGRLTQPDGDGVLLGMLIATSRIQCVVEAG